MERVYTITEDTNCAFTELSTISPDGRLVRRDQCPTMIQAFAQAISEVRLPRVMVTEDGQLDDWPYRGLREEKNNPPLGATASNSLRISRRILTPITTLRNHPDVASSSAKRPFTSAVIRSFSSRRMRDLPPTTKLDFRSRFDIRTFA